ncbi:hypothetical protein CC79DRAFT_1336949 [Sarocladium strictum]
MSFHLTTILLHVLFAAITAAEEGLNFDWPDNGQKLNLSAPLSLNYRYSRDSTFDNIPELDVVFTYKRNYTDIGEWDEEILMNYTLNGGRGTVEWDPSELLDAILEDGDLLAHSRVHYFEVKRHEKNSYFGMSFESPMYAVTAIEGVDNSAPLTQPIGCLMWLVAGTVAVAVS